MTMMIQHPHNHLLLPERIAITTVFNFSYLTFIHVELWFTPVIPDCIIQIHYYINDNFLNKTVHENSAPRGTKIIHIR